MDMDIATFQPTQNGSRSSATVPNYFRVQKEKEEKKRWQYQQ